MSELFGQGSEDIRQRLGDYLLAAGKLDPTDLGRSLSLPESGLSGLGSVLSNTGLLSDGDLASAYSEILALPLYVDEQPSATVATFPDLKESYLRSASILPLGVTADAIEVATANPEDVFALHALQLATGRKIKISIATKRQIETGLDRYFGKDQSTMQGLVDRLDDQLESNSEFEAIERLKDQAGEAPIIRLVNLIIQRAMEMRASDIHIEAFENQLKLRYRIDGVLRVVESPPPHSISAIISRIKLMARMNIAERRLPQDGGFQLRLQGKAVDVRVSTTPTLHGESLVLRILDKQNISISLPHLGFSEHYAQRLHHILKSPHGIVLVTGPTGSGKTTTLYAALNHLNIDERKIMTVEDPIEYQLMGINQIQVKHDIGLDFARALRSIVRQDPDIIMIGEMRDLETAKTAVQSALTGHLVLSTLHTNDATSSVIRLLDMGVENYLVTSTVIAIVAQRLVRKLCPGCREPYTPSSALIESFKLPSLPRPEALTLYRAKGCPDCDHQGYKGRSVISEILEMSEAIKQRLMAGDDETALRSLAREQGMITMAQDGIHKALAGITSMEEVLRVAFL